MLLHKCIQGRYLKRLVSGTGDGPQEIAVSPPAPALLLYVEVSIIDCLKRPEVSLQARES